MKKLFTLFFALLLFLLNIGLTFGEHYCGERRDTSTLIFGQRNEGCGMDVHQQLCLHEVDHSDNFSKMPCCQDLYKQLKISDQYTNVQDQDENQIHQNDNPEILRLELCSVFVDYPIVRQCIFEPPPRPFYQNFQIINQVFLI